jgi:molybdenum cofactor biosynthesis enzyme MoaA
MIETAPVRHPTLPKLRFTVAEKCQLKCVFCGGDDTKMENFQPDEMYGRPMLSLEAQKRIIESYVAANGEFVQFTGGEPTLNPNIYELTRWTREVGGIPEISTNGVSLHAKRAEKLRDAGIGVVKVSLPSFHSAEFAEITRVDAYDKIVRNISESKDIVHIRVTAVAMQHTRHEVDLMIDTCRAMGIKQLLLLELVYYPHLTDGKREFEESWVDIKRELAPLIERKLGARFEAQPFQPEFKNQLFGCRSPEDGFEVYFKQANSVLRVPGCTGCDHFCQEGAYEMRLSTGGYLSFCNVPNQYGVDLSEPENMERLDEIFEGFHQILGTGYDSPWGEFVDHHEIDFRPTGRGRVTGPSAAEGPALLPLL